MCERGKRGNSYEGQEKLEDDDASLTAAVAMVVVDVDGRKPKPRINTCTQKIEVGTSQ